MRCCHIHHICRQVEMVKDSGLDSLSVVRSPLWHSLTSTVCFWPKCHLSIHNSYNPNKQTSHFNLHLMGFCHKVVFQRFECSCHDNWWVTICFPKIRTYLRTTVVRILSSHVQATHFEVSGLNMCKLNVNISLLTYSCRITYKYSQVSHKLLLWCFLYYF